MRLMSGGIRFKLKPVERGEGAGSRFDWEDFESSGRTFIESDEFPIELVNRVSRREKGGGGRPPFWELSLIHI